MGTGPVDGPPRNFSQLPLLSGNTGILRIRGDKNIRGRDEQTGIVFQAARVANLLVGSVQGRSDRSTHRLFRRVPLQYLRHISLLPDGHSHTGLVQAPADLWGMRRHGRDLQPRPGTGRLWRQTGLSPGHGSRLHDLPQGRGIEWPAIAGGCHLEDQGSGGSHLEAASLEQGTCRDLQGVRELLGRRFPHRAGHRRRVFCLHETRRPATVGDCLSERIRYGSERRMHRTVEWSGPCIHASEDNHGMLDHETSTQDNRTQQRNATEGKKKLKKRERISPARLATYMRASCVYSEGCFWLR
mmetsp:Transcript_25988/g.71292  ORF Transcript_25988/g.71292 Transcript_25988/m.71292 type:complete len:299 (+) Transcript_25988:591-1487(+)